MLKIENVLYNRFNFALHLYENLADFRRKADLCTCQWWNTDRAKACPCVCVRRSVSKPKESIAGIKALIVYRGDPGIGASWVTWPLIDDKQRTNFLNLKFLYFKDK